MKLFLDTADIAEIRTWAETGLVDGVTTNPSLVAKSGRPFFEALKEICDTVAGPISAEVVALDAATMVVEGRKLSDVADNVVVKLPLTVEGLKACRALADDSIACNVTLCFSAAQALLAAKAGAAYISPFIGRLDDAGHDGAALLGEIREIYDIYGFSTEILAASIRSPLHVRDAALAGADCATLPAKVFGQLYQHPLTDKGLAAFLADWKTTGQTIV